MFFSKKNKKADISFFVYFTKLVKYRELLNSILKSSQQIKLLYYFEQTKQELEDILLAAKFTEFKIFNAREYTNSAPETLILVEVHPLASVTDQLLSSVHFETEIQCFIGMDEVLMKLFGSEKIVGLMKTMGMKPDEAISHSMVTKSIQRAQLKLDQKLRYAKDVKESPEQWAIENNLDQIVL